MDTFYKITGKDIEYNLANLSQIIFEVTDACNLRCKYCGYGELYEGYDERENLMFPIHKAKMIIDYLYSYWKDNYREGVITPISIGFYGGEPLMNINFIKEIINYLEALEPVGKKFHYNMTTNAMLLNKYMDFLVEKEFRLLISLDGDKLGQSYRVDAAGRNSFNRVFTNVNKLQSKYPEYFNKLVMFNSVLHNRNSVESIFHFIKNTYGKEPSISPLNTSGIQKDKIQDFYSTYQNFIDSIEHSGNCETLKNEIFINNPETYSLLNYLYYDTGNVFTKYNNLLISDKVVATPPSGTCIPFSKKMFVTVKGRILPCERINYDFALGIITDTGIELDMEKVADQHNGYIFKYANQCKKCSIRKSCSQCVYQIDNINDKDTRCMNYCSRSQFELNKSKCLNYLGKHPELYKRLLEEVVIRG